MKKFVSMILLVVIVLSISGCKKNDVIDDIPKVEKEVEEFEEIEEKGEETMKNKCQSIQPVALSQTETISAEDLWANSTTCNNLKLEGSLIKLDNISENGVLETNAFTVESFSELVPTWNVLIDDSSAVSVFVSIGNSLGYSEYYTMALWRNSYKSSFSRQEDEYGRKSIDTIIPKLDDIDRMKFKVIFTKSVTEATALKNLSITTVPKDSANNFDFSVLVEKSIEITPRQQLSVPQIGSSICSPTSLSMVLNYYNHSDSQVDVAGFVFDKGANIYGNWSFNASYAGGFHDIYSRVEYINDLATLVEYISRDIPVVLSISTQTKEALEGTIMPYPAGHLIVLSGFKLIDGTWFAVVNDPAEYEDSRVSREYKLEELLHAWKGYTYILQPSTFE